MKLTVTAILALAATVLAIPPENFGFPSAPNDTILSAGFLQANGSYQTLTEALLFGINIPANKPILGVQTNVYQSLAAYTGQYLVFMVDPDASTPQDPSKRFILHWMQPNMTLSNATVAPASVGLLPGSRELTNLTAPVAPYMRPAPPVNSSAHRYILYAFEQPSNFTVPAAYSGYGASNRTNFNLTRFIGDTHLGSPAAANYMYVSNQTAVAGDFVAAAGATYPGGNTGVVTSGDPGGAVIATMTSSSAAASSSGASSSRSTVLSGTSSAAAGATSTAATSTSRAGAAMVTGVSGLIGAGLVGLAALL